jgi:TolB protein
MRIRPIAVVLLIGLVAAAAAHGEPVQITTGERRDADPMVSPNGKHLVFASNRTSNFDIFLITFGQAGVSQLTQDRKDDRSPSWSPDSKKVVFHSKRTANGDIYEMAADGSSGYLQLTSKEEVEEYPCYGPSGGGLLFTTTPKKVVQLRPRRNIVFAQEKGRADQARLLAEGYECRFSPDGKKIGFVSHRTKNNDVWIMKADGGMQTQLTTNPKDDEGPCFSPAGKKIAFSSNRTGNFDIWVMDADGSNPRQLTSDPRDETQPCWSTGGYIYYTLKKSETQSHIYRIEAP